MGSKIVVVGGYIDVISTAIYSGLKVTDLEQLEFCYSPPHGASKDILTYPAMLQILAT